MSDQLDAFVDKARAKNLNDEEIKKRLLVEGWSENDINNALDGLTVPKPAAVTNSTPSVMSAPTGESANQSATVVVETSTTTGIEYRIMFLALWISAIAFGGLVHDMVDSLIGSNAYPHFGGLAAGTAMLVCFPIFALLFMRLKKMELLNPATRKDQFRKKSVQATVLFSFIIGVINIIYLVYITLSGGAVAGTEVSEAILHTLVTVGICGGIFAYYWSDIHRD